MPQLIYFGVKEDTTPQSLYCVHYIIIQECKILCPN